MYTKNDLKPAQVQGGATSFGPNEFSLLTRNVKIDFPKDLFVNKGPNRAERRRKEKEDRRRKKK